MDEMQHKQINEEKLVPGMAFQSKGSQLKILVSS
jgi:hypothetical protein